MPLHGAQINICFERLNILLYFRLKWAHYTYGHIWFLLFEQVFDNSLPSYAHHLIDKIALEFFVCYSTVRWMHKEILCWWSNADISQKFNHVWCLSIYHLIITHAHLNEFINCRQIFRNDELIVIKLCNAWIFIGLE